MTGAREPVDWGKVDELVARARTHKPLDPSMNCSPHVSRHTPKRVDVDNWSGSLGGGVRWMGTNCLRALIANLLRAASLERVPDPTPPFASPEWLDNYDVVRTVRSRWRVVCLGCGEGWAGGQGSATAAWHPTPDTARSLSAE